MPAKLVRSFIDWVALEKEAEKWRPAMYQGANTPVPVVEPVNVTANTVVVVPPSSLYGE